MSTISVEVEVDSSDVLSEISTKDLLAELGSRGDGVREDDAVIYENLYYALRDSDLEKAIEVINPVLSEQIGRTV